MDAVTGADGNSVTFNEVGAPTPYAVDAGDNVLLTAGAGMYTARSAVRVNRAGQNGFTVGS